MAAAQVGPMDSTIHSCNYKSTNLLFTDIGIDTVYYGNGDTTLYYDAEYRAQQSCGDGLDRCIQTQNVALKYYVFYPKKHNYTATQLPCIIIEHGGSFSDCSGIGTTTDIKTLCTEYAKRGWIAISLEYRRGNQQDTTHVAATANNNPVRYTSVYTVAAIYKGSQDTRGAYNSIIKRELNHNIFPQMKYRIDTSAIFMGGASAGSLLTMTAIYYQKQYMMDSIAPGAKAVFGSINYPYYYGDSATDYTKYIKGCMNMWGEWLLPPSVLSHLAFFFSQDRSIAPTIAFCGAKDSTFYPTTQNYYFDTARNFLGVDMKKTTFCLPFAGSYELFPKGGKVPDFVGYGSLKIYNLLKSAHIPVNLYYDCDALHGFETECSTCPFLANYGTANTNELQMEQYFAERSITFFQDVLLDSARFLNDTKFTDCENYIVTCHTKDSNNNCHNNDACPNGFGIDDGGDDGGVWESLQQKINPAKNKYYEKSHKISGTNYITVNKNFMVNSKWQIKNKTYSNETNSNSVLQPADDHSYKRTTGQP